jgi:hypothetical protein
MCRSIQANARGTPRDSALTGRMAARPSKIVHASDVVLPWCRPRAGRIASECRPMSYCDFAEIAIALIFGLTFALVGWWDIVGSIWSALQ